MCFSVNQIDDLQSSNKKYIVMNLQSSVVSTTEDGSTDAVPQILYGQYLILGGFGSCMF